MRVFTMSCSSLFALVLVAGTSLVANADPVPRFPASAVWNQDVSAAPLNPNSANMITHAQTHGAWGINFNIDFPFYILHATGTTPTDPVAGVGGYPDPDCDAPGFAFPLPAGGGRSGTGPTPSYTCSGDCYLLVVSGSKLYESTASNVTASTLQSACALTWDLSKAYPRQGRGEQCISTVQSGTPIAPLLFNADDMFAAVNATNGDIGHAIRFLLTDNKQGAYVHPATDGGLGGDTSADAMPMGSRLRLRADFPVETFIAGNLASSTPEANLAARVLLRTLMKYGMILSDAGSIPLTAESDYFTTHKWIETGMDPATQNGYTLLKNVTVNDFVVVNTGEPITATHDCVRIGADFIFIDGYEY